MNNTGTLILDHRQINHKIRRMAYQIYEHNAGEKEIVVAGIMSSGFKLAEKIAALLSEISPIKVDLCQIKIDKRNPLRPIQCSLDADEYENKVIIVADDVLNSGSTLIHSVAYFLKVPVKKIQTLVLVDRSHKNYPIKADFRGIYLSTSLNETVKVNMDREEEYRAELF